MCLAIEKRTRNSGEFHQDSRFGQDSGWNPAKFPTKTPNLKLYPCLINQSRHTTEAGSKTDQYNNPIRYCEILSTSVRGMQYTARGYSDDSYMA